MTVGLVALVMLQASPPPSPAAAVDAFYREIVRYHPIGIPTGEAKQALWPLLSARLARRLETLRACEDDYYRKNRKRLEAEQLKPTIGWLESGLFSGENEEAIPAEVQVARVEPAGEGRFRVHVGFTYRDAGTLQWTGIAVVVLESGRYAIDDYIPIDERSGKELTPLSTDFPECKGPRWVGLKGQRY
jgi:hypothetical protein